MPAHAPRLSTKYRPSSPIYVLIPTLNEAQSIGDVIRRSQKALAGMDHEIIVIDGSSTDGTSAIARKMGATVLSEKGRGYGAAYLTGFKYVSRKQKNSIIVMMDGDLTYPPEDIPLLLRPLLEGKADMALGDRFASMEEGAMSFRNRVGNRIISKLFSALYGMKINDSQTGFRAVTWSCLRTMYLQAVGMPLATEMLVEARKIGAQITNVPIRYAKRVGRSKIRAIRDSYGIIWTSLRLASELNPFILYGTVAFLFFLIGLGFGCYAFIGWIQWQFYGENTWPRLGSSLISVLFLVGATVVFALGILLDSLIHYLQATSHREKYPRWPELP